MSADLFSTSSSYANPWPALTMADILRTAEQLRAQPMTAADVREIVREEIEAAMDAREARADFRRLTAEWDARHGGRR